MKCKAALLILICCSCNTSFRQIAHEAAVAEQAIEADIDDDCPGCRSQAMSVPRQNEVNPTSIENHRQYPKRRPNRKDTKYDHMNSYSVKIAPKQDKQPKTGNYGP